MNEREETIRKHKIFLRDGTLSRKRKSEDLAEKIETETLSEPFKCIHHQNC